MKKIKFSSFLPLAAVLVMMGGSLSISRAAEDMPEGAPAAWQGGEKTGAEAEGVKADVPSPIKVFRPAHLPPGVIPAKTPVLYPRNQKVRVVPPRAMKLAESIVKVYPKPVPTPFKTVQPAAAPVAKAATVTPAKRAS